MIEGILIGLSAAFSIQNLLMVIAGCLIGTFIGMLPGLGPMSIIAIMIPVAISVGDPAAALILLAGVYYGAIFGGSTSSILLNAPGVAGTVATSFDGYPMARKGQAGKALTIAAVASFAGGTIGAILLAIFAPCAQHRGASVPFGRVFRPDGRGPVGHRGLCGHRPGRQGADDDRPGPHPRHRGRRRIVQHAALHLRDDGPAIGHLLHHAGHGDVRPARGDLSGAEPGTRRGQPRGRRQDHQPAVQPRGRAQHDPGHWPPVDPGLFHRRPARRGRDHRLVPRLCRRAQHRQGRGAGRVRQGLRQGAGRTRDRQQRRLHRLLRAASDAWHPRKRHHRDPAWARSSRSTSRRGRG